MDGDGYLTETDADMMCDDYYIDEEDKDKDNCKKVYQWIEYTYGYETQED